MAAILLTAARAQRAAAQYFGPSHTLPRPDLATHEFKSKNEARLLRVWQTRLGTVTFQEFHFDENGARQEVYKATYELPAIGPIDFTREVEN